MNADDARRQANNREEEVTPMSDNNSGAWVNPYPHVSAQNPYWHVDMNLPNGSHEQIPVQNLAAAELIRFTAFDK